MFFAHLRFWVPVLGWLLAGDREAYAYILPSLENYAGQRGVQAALERLGFVDCRYANLIGGAMAINGGAKPR
jgi:demethylmenaquinone methyltransferase/2-methoxy-6-polyprenyl-1,4-benzoquinol methylase